MKLGHILKYHNVFLKFDNGQYRTMSSIVFLNLFGIFLHVYLRNKETQQTLRVIVSIHYNASF